MSQDRYEIILEENGNLKRALASSKSVIERLANDQDTLKQIHEDFKMQFERLKRDNEEFNLRNLQLLSDKKELENQFDTTIRNLKIAIEQKQREIEEIQAKVIPSFDQDMLRIKVINELEIPHRQQLEAKQEELDRLNESIYDYKRQLETLAAKLELVQKENERDIKMHKERHSIEVNQLMNEITQLSERLEDNRDKDTIRRLRREADEQRQRAALKEAEAEELRAQRDKLRDEKNDNLIQYSKTLDRERSDKRVYKTESEKLSVRARFLEEENKRVKIKIESQNNELELANREVDNLYEEIRKKDDMIHQMQRRIAELEEENLQNETKNHEHSMRVYNDEHTKFVDERNKNLAMQREFEQLRKNLDDAVEDNKNLRAKLLKDVGELRTENTNLQEEVTRLKRQLSTVTKDSEQHEQNVEKKDLEINQLEREIEGLRKQLRENRTKMQTAFGTDYDQRNASVLQQQPQKLQEEVKTLRAKNEKLKSKVKTMKKLLAMLQAKMQAQTVVPGTENKTYGRSFTDDQQLFGQIQSLLGAGKR